MFKEALVLLEDGQLSRGTELLKKSLRLEPERLELRPYLARALFETKEYEAALRQLNFYLEREPKDHEIALFRVENLIALGRFEEARSALDSLKHDFQYTSWQWRNLKGFLEEEKGDYGLAESSYREAIELAEAGNYEPKTNLVGLLLVLERFDEADQLVDEMLGEAGENVDVLNSLALLLSKSERAFDPAPILRVIEKQEAPFELQYNLTAILAQRGELDQAALLAAGLVDTSAGDPRASWLYGRILLQRKELQEAGSYLLAARDRIPVSFESRQTLGFYSFLLGDFEEARDWFRQAFEMKPSSAEAAHNFSLSLGRTGELKRAADVSREAIALKEDPRFVYQLASVLDRDGKSQEALKAYRRFLSLSPSEKESAIIQERVSELEQNI